MKNNFLTLVKAKEEREGRKIDRTAMARETGVAYTTAKRWMAGGIVKFDTKTLTAVCDWLQCTLSQLLEYEPKIG